MKRIALMLALSLGAFATAPSFAGVTCSSITNDFCENLWSKETFGLLDTSEGKFEPGISPKSGTSIAELYDLQALADSVDRLPFDIRDKARPILDNLRVALVRINPSLSWYQSISDIASQLSRIASEAAEQRTFTRHPELVQIPRWERRTRHTVLFAEDAVAMSNEILEAKYKDHPNWKRVERVFGTVKKDIITAIDGFQITEGLKKSMQEKVASVKLLLPYTDPRLAAADAGCGTTVVNAFYSPDKNIFTVCAGWFNIYQTDSTTYQVVAHELGHSIDPTAYAMDEFQKTPTGLALARLLKANGNLPCDEWSKMAGEAIAAKPAFTNPVRETDRLTSCLKPLSPELKEYKEEPVDQAAELIALSEGSSLADGSNFTLLSVPKYNFRGDLRDNDFYLNPHFFRSNLTGGLLTDQVDVSFPTPELFVQNLRCLKADGKTFADFGESPERGKLFEAAIKTTLAQRKNLNELWFDQCGRACPDLVQFKLSRNVHEDFADWIARKAQTIHLAKESLARRREIISIAVGWNCSPPSPVSSAPDLSSIEKENSFEPHPDSSVRRMSIFSKDIRDLLQCDTDSFVAEGSGSCELTSPPAQPVAPTVLAAKEPVVPAARAPETPAAVAAGPKIKVPSRNLYVEAGSKHQKRWIRAFQLSGSWVCQTESAPFFNTLIDVSALPSLQAVSAASKPHKGCEKVKVDNRLGEKRKRAESCSDDPAIKSLLEALNSACRRSF